MCSRRRSIFDMTGVSHHAARMRGRDGSQPAPLRCLSGNMSKSCCHLCGCGHTRLFFWTSANISSRVVMFRWYESAMKEAHRPVVAHGLSSCHYAYGMATKNFRSWTNSDFRFNYIQRSLRPSLRRWSQPVIRPELSLAWAH